MGRSNSCALAILHAAFPITGTGVRGFAVRLAGNALPARRAASCILLTCGGLQAIVGGSGNAATTFSFARAQHGTGTFGFRFPLGIARTMQPRKGHALTVLFDT